MLELIRYLGQYRAKEDYEKEKFNVQNDIYREAELGAAKIWRRYVPVFEFLSYVLTIILMLVGGIMVVKGQMTLGDLVAVNGYLWMLTVPLRMAGCAEIHYICRKNL